MTTKLQQNGDIWSAAAKSAQRTAMPFWLDMKHRVLHRHGPATSQSAAVGGALQKEEIVWLLREVTA
jgi:hypothetical protein